MAKTIDIPYEEWIEQFKAFIQTVRSWLENFFRTITTYEAIAVGAIALGFILLITGIIIV